MLNLKEHLNQARDGCMNDEDLKQWLKDLQREFVAKMVELDEEKDKIEREGMEGEDEEILDGEEGMDVDGGEGGCADEASTGQSTVGGSDETSIRTKTTKTS